MMIIAVVLAVCVALFLLGVGACALVAIARPDPPQESSCRGETCTPCAQRRKKQQEEGGTVRQHAAVDPADPRAEVAVFDQFHLDELPRRENPDYHYNQETIDVGRGNPAAVELIDIGRSTDPPATERLDAVFAEAPDSVADQGYSSPSVDTSYESSGGSFDSCSDHDCGCDSGGD